MRRKIDEKLETVATDLKAAGITKAEAIAAFARIWDREQTDVIERLRKLQAARLREARKLRGFKSARAAQLHYGWSSAYGSHENGTRGIGRMYLEYARNFRVKPAWLLGHSVERDYAGQLRGSVRDD